MGHNGPTGSDSGRLVVYPSTDASGSLRRGPRVNSKGPENNVDRNLETFVDSFGLGAQSAAAALGLLLGFSLTMLLGKAAWRSATIHWRAWRLRRAMVRSGAGSWSASTTDFDDPITPEKIDEAIAHMPRALDASFARAARVAASTGTPVRIWPCWNRTCRTTHWLLEDAIACGSLFDRAVRSDCAAIVPPDLRTPHESVPGSRSSQLDGGTDAVR